MIDTAFFGCWNESGHFLRDKTRTILSDHVCHRNHLPEDRYFDGSQLLLPYPDNPGYGQCTYLPSCRLTILSWWNRVFDARGGVNSHFMIRGKYDDRPDIMWSSFQHVFPDLAKHHTKPIIQVYY